jgi:hypothetical protein
MARGRRSRSHTATPAAMPSDAVGCTPRQLLRRRVNNDAMVAASPRRKGLAARLRMLSNATQVRRAPPVIGWQMASDPGKIPKKYQNNTPK